MPRFLSEAMHKIIPEDGNLVRVDVSGKLTQEDYDALIPSLEQVIARHGSMRLLFVMENFHGWDAGAAWDDFRFGITHASKVGRVAMVGEKSWQKWMAKLGSYFSRDAVKYFDHSQMAEAERWVRA
ncbi:MAG: STAS/SEC14 domain-containing protein [Verrucomicrobiota bacterium]|nr:STAS/SEC14 domain-containing protein [Verrucomicrobiota bacterium]